jgi:hypothetical protein
MNWILNFFGRKKTNKSIPPIAFFRNYLSNAKRARIMLDIRYKNNLIAQVEPIKFNQSWLSLIHNNSTSDNQDKLILYTVNGHPLFRKHDKDNTDYEFIDEEAEGYLFRTFYKLIDTNISTEKFIEEYRRLIVASYSLKGKDPMIDFFIHQE